MYLENNQTFSLWMANHIIQHKTFLVYSLVIGKLASSLMEGIPGNDFYQVHLQVNRNG